MLIQRFSLIVLSLLIYLSNVLTNPVLNISKLMPELLVRFFVSAITGLLKFKIVTVHLNIL